MTKKKFQDFLLKYKNDITGIFIKNNTTSSNRPMVMFYYSYKNKPFYKGYIKGMRGYENDEKVIKEFDKYVKWFNEIIEE